MIRGFAAFEDSSGWQVVRFSGFVWLSWQQIFCSIHWWISPSQKQLVPLSKKFVAGRKRYSERHIMLLLPMRRIWTRLNSDFVILLVYRDAMIWGKHHRTLKLSSNHRLCYTVLSSEFIFRSATLYALAFEVLDTGSGSTTVTMHLAHPSAVQWVVPSFFLKLSAQVCNDVGRAQFAKAMLLRSSSFPRHPASNQSFSRYKCSFPQTNMRTVLWEIDCPATDVVYGITRVCSSSAAHWNCLEAGTWGSWRSLGDTTAFLPRHTSSVPLFVPRFSVLPSTELSE